MTVMYLLIAFSLLIATGFVVAFIWAIRSGQYDDKYTPSVRVLFDDELVKADQNQAKKGTSTSQISNSAIHNKENSSTQTIN